MRYVVMLAAACLAAPSGVWAEENPPQQRLAPEQKPPKGLAKILAKNDGLTRETAFKVGAVKQEYQIVRYFGFEPEKQALVMDKHAYDVITATNPKTGETREFWFDISSFYGFGF